MLIFTFLSTLLKYMVVAALCGQRSNHYGFTIVKTISGLLFSVYERVRLWVNEFKEGRISIEDAPRSGTSKSAVTPGNIDKVQDIVLAGRRMEVHELAQAVSILIELVHFILHHELHIK